MRASAEWPGDLPQDMDIHLAEPRDDPKWTGAQCTAPTNAAGLGQHPCPGGSTGDIRGRAAHR